MNDCAKTLPHRPAKKERVEVKPMIGRPSMTHRERVLSSLARQGYDRIPVKHEGTPEVDRALMSHFGLSNLEQLLRVLGDDFRYVSLPYIGPELRTFPDGSFEGYWGERYKYAAFDGGQFPESVFQPLAGIETLDKLDRTHFPTADWFDYSTVREQAERLRKERFAVCFGTAGDMDFINSIARARGMEEVLMDLATDNEVYLEIMEARFRFYFEQHERVLQAADGLIDIVHIGEDLGNQRGPMIGMRIFDRHFAPRFKSYFDMVHGYGAKTMMHMCGCVERFLPRLIELGLDIEDVVQPTTPKMDVAYLQEHYGARLNFCGSVCVQSTLPSGSEEDVVREITRRLHLFPQGGLFLGPTHAIQAGTPVRNVVAMYRTAGSLCERIDDSILSIQGDPGAVGKIDMSKLF
jgi:uroporphyrinogen decarboxylase